MKLSEIKTIAATRPAISLRADRDAYPDVHRLRNAADDTLANQA
jgi:hypothetical protein